MKTRREWLQLAAGVVAAALPGTMVRAQRAPAADQNALEVWKSATCGCCKLWVDHMQANGFKPLTHDVPDVAPYKRKYGVPTVLESCHTAVVAGYALEGHVPADLVRQLLKQRPAGVIGLAVPGMPAGSPGMEGARKDPYDVLTFDKSGRTTVFAKR